MRCEILPSIPSKAPPQIKRIFFVSTCSSSWSGCLRPPLGGTLTIEPSNIFKRLCCTPSPLTSRVMDIFSDLRAILSISSMKIIPRCAFFTSKSASCNRRTNKDSTSSPTYPACVKAVASPIAKGTFSIFAIVRANKVFPVPVEPTSKILLFSISTSSLLISCRRRL